MAPPKAPPRRLFEMLEEEQEPFFLDSDDHRDNGYSETRMQAKSAFLCWILKNPCLKLRKGGAFVSKLGCWEVMRRTLNWKHRALHCRRSRILDCLHEVRSKSYVTSGRFRRLLYSDAEGGELDGDNEWKDVIEQFSPLSVLDLRSDDGSSFHNHSMVEEEEENSLISLSLDSPTEDDATLPLHEEAKREISPPSQEENQWVDLSLINNSICLDFHESGKEWSQFHDQRREIRMQIENFILEELREECVSDMLL